MYGDPMIKNLQALACWATDLHKRGIALNPAYFTATTLLEYKQLARAQQLASNQTSDVQMPKPLLELSPLVNSTLDNESKSLIKISPGLQLD